MFLKMQLMLYGCSRKKVSRDESTHAYENASDAKNMSQNRVSRDGATCASENAAHDEMISQRRVSRAIFTFT